MLARQWSIIRTLALLTLVTANVQAVEFVVTDNGKPAATRPAANRIPAASKAKAAKTVDAVMPTSRPTSALPTEMLSPPSEAIGYPDPSVPFDNPLSTPSPDLSEVTVPLESIRDPAGTDVLSDPAADCNCGDLSLDSGPTLHDRTFDHSAGYEPFDFAAESGCGCPGTGCSGGCQGNGCGKGLSTLFDGLQRGNNCQSCCGDQGAGWFIDLWIAQGFTYNEHNPASGSNLPLTFNDRDDKYLMNQLYLSFGKAVSTTSWDFGARVDLLYGTDYFFTQATGLETREDGSPWWNSSDGPRGTGAALYGLAMPQAYLELGVPFGTGTSVKFGHFYTILGYESVMAPENFFYSHAYTMQYGEPFTHTGVLADIGITQSFNFLAGITNGWDAWEDPNDELGYLLGFSWCPSELSSLSFGIASGNEDAEGVNDRTVYSLVYTRQLTDKLQYVFQHDFGTESNAALDQNFNADNAKWYGINQYLFMQMSEALTVGVRVEWFRDQDNARVLGIPSESLTEGGNYVGLSFGANYRPNCRWIFRPEIRWDWSDAAATGLGGTGMYDDFTKDNQLTLASDVIFRF